MLAIAVSVEMRRSYELFWASVWWWCDKTSALGLSF